jgi:hypothetical protein
MPMPSADPGVHRHRPDHDSRKPSVLAKMLTPRRFLDHRYAALVAPELYGGAARRDPMVGHATVSSLFSAV